MTAPCPHCTSQHGTPVAEQRVEMYEYWAIYRLNPVGEREWFYETASEMSWTWDVRHRRRFWVKPSGEHVVHVTITRRCR